MGAFGEALTGAIGATLTSASEAAAERKKMEKLQAIYEARQKAAHGREIELLGIKKQDATDLLGERHDLKLAEQVHFGEQSVIAAQSKQDLSRQVDPNKLQDGFWTDGGFMVSDGQGGTKILKDEEGNPYKQPIKKGDSSIKMIEQLGEREKQLMEFGDMRDPAVVVELKHVRDRLRELTGGRTASNNGEDKLKSAIADGLAKAKNTGEYFAILREVMDNKTMKTEDKEAFYQAFREAGFNVDPIISGGPKTSETGGATDIVPKGASTAGEIGATIHNTVKDAATTTAETVAGTVKAVPNVLSERGATVGSFLRGLATGEAEKVDVPKLVLKGMDDVNARYKKITQTRELPKPGEVEKLVSDMRELLKSATKAKDKAILQNRIDLLQKYINRRK